MASADLSWKIREIRRKEAHDRDKYKIHRLESELKKWESWWANWQPVKIQKGSASVGVATSVKEVGLEQFSKHTFPEPEELRSSTTGLKIRVSETEHENRVLRDLNGKLMSPEFWTRRSWRFFLGSFPIQLRTPIGSSHMVRHRSQKSSKDGCNIPEYL